DVLAEAETFEKGIKNYVSAPINMFQVKVEDPTHGDMSFMRVGVISDMRNGWVSLAELQRLKEAPLQEQHALATETRKFTQKLEQLRQDVVAASKKETTTTTPEDNWLATSLLLIDSGLKELASGTEAWQLDRLLDAIREDLTMKLEDHP